MAFSLLRLSNRLTYLALVERNFSATCILAGRPMLQHNQRFSTTPPLRSSKKTLVEQARDFSKHPLPADGDRVSYQSAQSDSDSDREGRVKVRQRGNSDFWRRKMRTLHAVLDINKDGVISYDDFVILTNKFADLGHLSQKNIDEFRAVMQETWESQWGEINPYNLVTVEQFLTDMHHVLNEKSLRKKAHRFLPYLFKAIDKDRNGHICLREYKLFFRCLGLDDDAAAVSFACIDINSDGKLTLSEFEKLGRLFFLTEDEEHASRMFWGPLVDH